VFLVFLTLSFVSVQAWDYPDTLCEAWSCSSCTYSITFCYYAAPLHVGHTFEGCQTGGGEMCNDNEFTCVDWCYSLAQALDVCKGWPSGCWDSWPGGSACDEMAGTMSCNCRFMNLCDSK